MLSRQLPGIRTEAFARPPGTVVHEESDHLWWDTPDFRATWWGHALVVDRPPATLEPWVARWAEVHRGKGIGRAYIAWEHRTRKVPPLPEGAEHEAHWTLMCDQALDRLKGPAEIRSLTPDQADACDQLAAALGEEPVSMGWAIRGWLQRAADGQGHLWGGWIDEELVAVVGLFHDEREARTQWVATHPEHRRRGLCRQLLTHAVFHHQERHAGIVYTVAEADGVAEGLYRALGWRRCTALDCVSLPAPG